MKLHFGQNPLQNHHQSVFSGSSLVTTNHIPNLSLIFNPVPPKKSSSINLRGLELTAPKAQQLTIYQKKCNLVVKLCPKFGILFSVFFGRYSESSIAPKPAQPFFLTYSSVCWTSTIFRGFEKSGDLEWGIPRWNLCRKWMKLVYGGFLKWWVSPTTIGFPYSKMTILGVPPF